MLALDLHLALAEASKIHNNCTEISNFKQKFVDAYIDNHSPETKICENRNLKSNDISVKK